MTPEGVPLLPPTGLDFNPSHGADGRLTTWLRCEPGAQVPGVFLPEAVRQLEDHDAAILPGSARLSNASNTGNPLGKVGIAWYSNVINHPFLMVYLYQLYLPSMVIRVMVYYCYTNIRCRFDMRDSRTWWNCQVFGIAEKNLTSGYSCMIGQRLFPEKRSDDRHAVLRNTKIRCICRQSLPFKG